MPEFEKPSFSYEYEVDAQRAALRQWRDTEEGRQIPAKADDRLLVATWNVANLGAQDRRDKDHRLIAEICSWFDVVALQEVKDDLRGLRGVRAHLPAHFEAVYSDAGGNDERLAFLYDARKLTIGEEIGELALAPAELRYIRLPGSDQRFDGFDRNPYLTLFTAGSFTFQLASVHLYFGSDSKVSMNRRSLETLVVARWADMRRKSPYASTKDIIALGDFNLPKAVVGDPIFDQLTKRGLQLPQHSTQIGSAIRSDSHYDQIAFFPGESGDQFTGRAGVFDFDGAVFHHLWETRGRDDFISYCQYYLSDHRPLWAEFAI